MAHLGRVPAKWPFPIIPCSRDLGARAPNWLDLPVTAVPPPPKVLSTRILAMKASLCKLSPCTVARVCDYHTKLFLMAITSTLKSLLRPHFLNTPDKSPGDRLAEICAKITDVGGCAAFPNVEGKGHSHHLIQKQPQVGPGEAPSSDPAWGLRCGLVVEHLSGINKGFQFYKLAASLGYTRSCLQKKNSVFLSDLGLACGIALAFSQVSDSPCRAVMVTSGCPERRWLRPTIFCPAWAGTTPGDPWGF